MMSRHTFRTTWNNKNVEVAMGWDRVMEYYFMVITDLNACEEDETDIIYSNLDEDQPYSDSLSPYLAILDEKGIKIPRKMIEATERTLENKSIDFTGVPV